MIFFASQKQWNSTYIHTFLSLKYIFVRFKTIKKHINSQLKDFQPSVSNFNLLIASSGGYNGNGDVEKDVYMYDSVSNTRKDAGKMTTPRRGHSVALRDEDSDFYDCQVPGVFL